MGLSRLPLAMISAVFLLFPLADCGGGGGGWRGCWPADQPGRRAGVRGPCSLAEASDAMETKWRGCAGLRLRGGDSDSDEDGSGMELQGMTSSTDEGGGGKKDAESEGHAAQGGANSVLDDTDLDDPSVIDDGDKLSEVSHTTRSAPHPSLLYCFTSSWDLDSPRYCDASFVICCFVGCIRVTSN